MKRWWPWKAQAQTQARVEPCIGRPTEIEEADVQAAYVNGLVQGELRGRLALIHEIQMQFAPNTTQNMTAEAAETLRLKQVH